MSATKINIANQGLLLLGGVPLTSLNDNTKQSVAVETFWGTSYRSALSAHRWNFATKRIEMAPSTDVPLWEWPYAYLLPDDFIKVQYLWPQSTTQYMTLTQDQWQREGEYILCRINPLYMKYTYECPIGHVDATFEQVLAAQLAYQMAYFITASSTKAKEMMGLYQERLDEARSQEGMEQISEITTTAELMAVR